MLVKTLEQFGFNQRQAKIYLACLELGEAPASSIARFCNENRLTSYSILKELLKKWFIFEISKNNINYYTAVSPEKIFKDYQDKLSILEKKLPELMTIMNKFDNRPKLLFYEGVEGVKSVYDEILKTKEPLYAFLSDDNIAPELKEYLNETFIAKRKKKKIHASVIVRETPANKQYLSKTKKNKLTEIRIIHDDLLWLEWELVLFWENKIACALYSPDELSWFLIESKQLYSSLKSIFMFIWNQL